ncbi:NnrU family protein [Prosthecomicrobium sp. N25]|uniref:NnrU family protein n=1 Tax=Prosthecomicrobium sp. N25 TaxID=3129254 RepID=UPI0030779316
MLLLVLGLFLFLGAHTLPMSRDRRAGLVARLGEGGYKGLFTALSLAGLVLIVWGYGQARAEGALLLWDPPRWTRHLAALLLVPVFPLLAVGKRDGFIRGTVKHPMLTAVKLWAAAHLIANGTLPDVLLFGSFLAWAVVDRISVKRRGEPNPPRSPWTRGDTIAVVAGLALYAAFAWRLHLWLIGVSPFG